MNRNPADKKLGLKPAAIDGLMRPNKPTGGVRDGPFIVFRNWDMSMHDIAYYPNLWGQISSLKNVTLSNLGALITAFNSDGWMKSCPHHDFSSGGSRKGSTPTFASSILVGISYQARSLFYIITPSN
jgi:hypothetical protein